MAYQPEIGEVFFCGKCGQQQKPKQGEQCVICKKLTVSWYTKKEIRADALRKWKQING